MEWHIKQAIDAGVSPEQILEAIGVAIETGGGPATVAARFAMHVLEYHGRQEKMAKTLVISEIFHSLQGESTRAGMRCAFVRLIGCNLSCAWCDTLYSREEEGRELTLPMIVEALRPYRTKLAEITGGEPLMQAATPDLAAMLAHEGYEVLVETNGSMDISVLAWPAARIMDLKTPSSGMSHYNRLANLVHLRRGDEVKFVIADRMDYEWTRTMIQDADYPRDLVATLLSPAMGMVSAAELAGWMVDDKLDARLNLQQHKVIWPDIDRGV